MPRTMPALIAEADLVGTFWGGMIAVAIIAAVVAYDYFVKRKSEGPPEFVDTEDEEDLDQDLMDHIRAAQATRIQDNGISLEGDDPRFDSVLRSLCSVDDDPDGDQDVKLVMPDWMITDDDKDPDGKKAESSDDSTI